MKIFKKIINIIFEPFNFSGSSSITLKIVRFSDNNKWFLYTLTTLIVLLMIFLKYILPNLK